MNIQNMDIQKIYVRAMKGFVEYQGQSNFLDGKRNCPECDGNMIRTPIGQPYIPVSNGKILVDVSGVDGRLVVSKAEPDIVWTCNGCPNAITQKIKPMAE